MGFGTEPNMAPPSSRIVPVSMVWTVQEPSEREGIRAQNGRCASANQTVRTLECGFAISGSAA
jgi:hypothetical protein